MSFLFQVDVLDGVISSVLSSWFDEEMTALLLFYLLFTVFLNYTHMRTCRVYTNIPMGGWIKERWQHVEAAPDRNSELFEPLSSTASATSTVFPLCLMSQMPPLNMRVRSINTSKHTGTTASKKKVVGLNSTYKPGVIWFTYMCA